MKRSFSSIYVSVIIIILISCSDTKRRYINLSTGEPVEVVKDEKTGLWLDKESAEPLYIYVDTKTNDTIYGKTGEVINGHVILGSDKKYVYDNDEKLKIDNNGGVKHKEGNYKVEVEKDGDVKIKNGDKKVKIDAETGERKVKND